MRRRSKAALAVLAALLLVCGGVAAGMAWEAAQKRVCACFCSVKVPGYLN